VADTTTSVLTLPLKPLYGEQLHKAFTQVGQFWRAGRQDFTQSQRTGSGTARAKSVVFDIWSAGTVSTTALGENADGTAVSLGDSQETATLAEYGRYVHLTHKVKATAYSDTLAQAAWMMGDLAGRTMDTLARDALDSQTGATWVGYGSGGSTDATSVATITKGNTLEATDVRKAWAKLKNNNVPPMADGYYWAFIHPHVLKDLQDETGDASWVKAVQYSNKLDTLDPIRDEAGLFSSFRFIVTTNAKLQSKAGNGTTTSAASADVYTTYFLGQDALGFGYSTDSGEIPELKIGLPSANAADAFARFTTVAWYALAGFVALRDDSLYKVYSSSSLAANGA